jgi:hypothetical protein
VPVRVPGRRRSGWWLLAVIALIAWWVWPGKLAMYRKPLDPAAVLVQVRALNELVTVKYSVQKVVGLKEKRALGGEESILLLVEARVLAGVELNELNAGDVTMPSREEARIRLPGPRILENFLEEKETKVWDRRVTWWTPWVAADPDLEHKARLEALEQVRAAAVQMGILKDAQRNAERDIRAVLLAFGITKVVFLPT